MTEEELINACRHCNTMVEIYLPCEEYDTESNEERGAEYEVYGIRRRQQPIQTMNERISEVRREAGRKGGKARTEAKAKAARRNGSSGKPMSRSRWLALHGLELHKTKSGWYLMRPNGELMQTVSVWPTPEAAINNWASEHGFDGPKGGTKYGM